ncbi:MAG: DUF2834 domain-containing protein [Elainella sp.]
MMLTTLYLLLCVAGTILPYSQFVRFLLDEGFNLPLLFDQLFATPISSCFGLDVLVSAAVVLTFVQVEEIRLGLKQRWICLVCTVLVGPSLGLPLFLLMRHLSLTSQIEQNAISEL